MNTLRGIILIFLLLAIITFIPLTGATDNYDPSDPNTWSSRELKEWLAERRVSYTGIPEKHDLVLLVKAHWVDVKDQAKSTKEAVKRFVTKYIEAIKDTVSGTNDKISDYVGQLTDQFEDVRQYAGLTEEQVGLVFDQLNEKLKGTKTSEDLTKILGQIKQSYASAKARRDILIQETITKIQNDLRNNEITQETIDWFKEEIRNFGGDSEAFSRERLGTQASLILQGVQEKLTQLNATTGEQTKMVVDKLKSSVEDICQPINGRFERLRKELSDTIGGTAESVVEELKSQFSTVNDYRLLTQENIQSVIDHIGQKLQDGKTVTVEQLQNVKDIVKRFFGTFKYYYNTATGQTKQTVLETKEAQEERLNKIIATIQNRINEARKKRDQQLEQVLKTIENDLTATHQLTVQQVAVLSGTVKEQLGNVRYARDLTEDKVKSFLDVLKSKLLDVKDYAEESYEAAYNKVSGGYDAATDKLGEGFDKVKEQMMSHKDEL
ncbi:10017_t:CDS:2 [Acaulospora colombiana]|uniref:10017_t:CDS:1 n=1 Tax=Acaulospora colombiana TaxID=27376 RepID=A0ACA9KVQ2_9GLOM|nr:10017_t:CDS:2 [Acaulospora colombiana]